MDNKTNISSLKEKVRKFCSDRDWDKYHNAKDLAIGISTEASEILEHFRFKSESEIEKMFLDATKKEEISDEVADVFYCILRLSERYNIDLTSALTNKMVKIDKKYPVEKCKGKNDKYTEL